MLAGVSGTGRLEYQQPFVLFGAGQNTIIEDFGKRKFLVFSAAAKPASMIVGDSLLSRASWRVSPRFGGADDDSRMYFELPAIAFDQTTGARASDSASILRVDPRTSHVDTMAFLHLPAGSTRVSGGRPGEGLSIMTGVENPFAPHPAWVVAPDGGVAIVHAAPYQVEWIEKNGSRRSGPTIDFDKIAVTDADISGTPAGIGASVGIGGLGARGAGASVPPTRGGRDDWPATKTPFLRGDVRADLRGRVWVHRSTRADDRMARYDVFDRTGRLVARYVLPERTRVVGVGASSVYVARATDDGERLEAFRLP